MRVDSKYLIKLVISLSTVFGIFFLSRAFAASGGGSGEQLGSVASHMMGSMDGLAKLVTSGSLVAGLGFFIGAILKFKQHKDNPTQIPVGTPIALVFIACMLVFLPSLFSTIGHTVFNTPIAADISGTNFPS